MCIRDSGNTLVLSIDIKLQALVEQLFGDRRGALVAIDPRNGEVLAFVSKPSFDPNLFVDGIDVESWRGLNESLDKPLLNRALRGTYPPGSTFKPFMAIAALNSGKRGPVTIVHDGGSYNFGGHVFRSHGDHGLGPVDMRRSIVASSNVYYYSLANELGVDLMHEQLLPFGFGRKTGIDLDGESIGLLPSQAWKRRAYKRPELQKWYPGETISVAIGQGAVTVSPMAMAMMMATVGNGGTLQTPHLVKAVDRGQGKGWEPVPPPNPRSTFVMAPDHLAAVREGLWMAVNTPMGTATRRGKIDGKDVSGKTGTCLLYTSPSPRDRTRSRMPSSA